MPDKLGPFADVQVVIAARGMRQVQELLHRGWSILSIEFCDELVEGGANARHQVRGFVPYAILGRAFSEGEDHATVSEAATEASEDALNDGRTIVVAREGDETDPDAPARLRHPLQATHNAPGTLQVGDDVEPETAADGEENAAAAALREVAQSRGRRRASTAQPQAGEDGYEPAVLEKAGAAQVKGLPAARRD